MNRCPTSRILCRYRRRPPPSSNARSPQNFPDARQTIAAVHFVSYLSPLIHRSVKYLSVSFVLSLLLPAFQHPGGSKTTSAKDPKESPSTSSLMTCKHSLMTSKKKSSGGLCRQHKQQFHHKNSNGASFTSSSSLNKIDRRSVLVVVMEVIIETNSFIIV
jgi:hypothetical protein